MVLLGANAFAISGSKRGGYRPAYPVFVQKIETGSWNSGASPRTTSSFDVLAGDVLVAYLIAENDQGTMGAATGGSLTWTEQQKVDVGGYAEVIVWTAVVDTNKSMTISFTRTGNVVNFGGGVMVFRNTGGVGASSKANTSAPPYLPDWNITTTKANSIVVVVTGDWSAVDGSTRTWRTNAGSLTEQTYYFQSGVYTAYAGYHANAGAIGTKAVGLTAPSGQTWSGVAVEIKAP